MHYGFVRNYNDLDQTDRLLNILTYKVANFKE